MLRHIHLCADDFGLTPGINASILDLAARGRLSATSCMSTAPNFTPDARALLELPIQTGLHLNLTEALESQRFYQPLPKLLRNSYLHRLDPEVITREIEHQLDVFENTLGRAPDYVDGHQHVHQFPVVRDRLIDVLLRRYPLHRPWLRSTVPGTLTGLPPGDQFKARFIGFLGARSLKKLAVLHGFPMNGHLLGVYGFAGGESVFNGLLQRWLACVSSHDLIMCHPARVADPVDGIGAQRVSEHAVLSSNEFPGLLERYSISLLKRDRGSFTG